MPRFQDIVTDNDLNGLPGAIITVRDYPSGSLSTLTDDGGVALINPLTADSNGAYFFNANPGLYSLEYRLLPFEPARKVTLTDISEQSDFGTQDLGVLSNTGDSRFVIDKTASGNSGGASDWRAVIWRMTYGGGFGTSNQINGSNWQNNFNHTAGTITFAYGTQGYNSLGGGGSSGVVTGAITSSRGVEWHTANKSSNGSAINTAVNFFSGDVDLDRPGSTGVISSMSSFFSGNQGHATRVTGSAVGFDQGDMTGGAPITAAFRSQITPGTNKWGYYGAGGANNSFAGNVRIGDNTAPSDKLELKGYAKLGNLGTYTVVGQYHELISSNNDYVAHCRNTHASPMGFRVRFTAASPNNKTQVFILCEDSTTTRFQVFSDGSLFGLNATFTETTAASVPTPSSNTQTLFLDSADHKLKRKDSSGTVTIIA